MDSYQIAEHHLGRRFLVLVPNSLDLGVVNIIGSFFRWIGPAQRTVSGHHNVILFAQSNQFLLVQSWMAFDLKRCLYIIEFQYSTKPQFAYLVVDGLDLAVGQKAGQLFGIEIRNANALGEAQLHQLFHGTPGVQVVNVAKINTSVK